MPFSKYSPKQKKLARVASPRNKITGADFSEIMTEESAQVSFSDPFFEKVPTTRKYNLEKIEGIKINSKNLEKFDLVILSTDHDIFDYDLIAQHSKVIVDTRGRFSRNKKNILKA